jgi:hypothetical protein
VSEIKGITPKGDALTSPTFKVTGKGYGSEPTVPNVVSEKAAFQNEPPVGNAYKSMVSPLKKK